MAPGKRTLTEQLSPGTAVQASAAPGKQTLTGQLSPTVAPGAAAAVVGRAVIKRDCCVRVGPSHDAALVPQKPDWVAKGAALDVYAVTGSWLQIKHAELPAYITGGSAYVTYTPVAPPPAPSVESPAEQPGVVDQITTAAGSAIDAVTGAVQSGAQSGVDAVTGLGRAMLSLFGATPSEPTTGEDQQLQREPVDPATGAPTDRSAPPPTDIAAVEGTQHFVQTHWYGADGKELAAAVKDTCVTVLNDHDVLEDYATGGRGEVYNDVLKLPSAQRPASITAKHKLRDEAGELVKDAKGRQAYSEVVTEPVPTKIKELPQLKFIPGSASCLRTAEAMAIESGATIEEGSGVATSHIQMILATDQEAVVNADGKALKTDGKVAGKNDLQARDTKSTEDITADAGADHLAQIQANVKLASDFMDAELAAGRAVVIGVSYTNRDGNSDDVTDHWMCVHAKIAGGYAYFDPGASGTNGEGVLQPNPAKGGILEGHNNGRTYALAQVRLNQESSGGPSPADVSRSMKDVAADANGKLAKTADAPAPAS